VVAAGHAAILAYGGPARRGAAGDSWSGEIPSGLIGLERIRGATRSSVPLTQAGAVVGLLGVRVSRTLKA
jgi:hypothetical protein